MGRPLSLVVLGNSAALMSIPRPDRRSGPWPELLADRLSDELGPTTLALHARWFEMIPGALAAYEERVTTHAPDIVVIQYGYAEMQPWLAPMWLLRHLITDHTASRPVGVFYRSRIAPRLWRWLRSFRRWLARRVGTRGWQLRPERFERLLHHLIRSCRDQHQALVIVLDIHPPTDKVEAFLPGMRERYRIYQSRLRSVVERFDDPEVALVPISTIIEEIGLEAAMTDGIHFSPDTHRAIAEQVTREVMTRLERG